MPLATPLPTLYTTRVGATELSLIQGAVQTLPADAIVCYASTSLTLHSNLARQLVMSGGTFIRHESGKHAPAEVGDAVLLPTGKLPGRHLLVAVTNRQREAPTLESISACMSTIVARAAQLGLSSLAIPLLRVGRALAPADVLRATLAPLCDHCSGYSRLSRLLIVIGNDESPAAHTGLLPYARASLPDLARLGQLRAQAAALNAIEGRLADTLALGVPAIEQLRSRQIALQRRIEQWLMHSLEGELPGPAAITLELRRCADELARLSHTWLAPAPPRGP